MEAATATPDNGLQAVSSEPARCQTDSPPRQRTALFASYDKLLTSPQTSSSNPPLAASVVVQYLDSLQELTIQARGSRDPWISFRTDQRFVRLHLVMEKYLCIPATSAPVERVFSHGGLFMRPHRARLGENVLSQLVFAKCNKHLM